MGIRRAKNVKGECSGVYAGRGFEGVHVYAPNPMTGRIECIHCGQPTNPVRYEEYGYVCRRESLDSSL